MENSPLDRIYIAGFRINYTSDDPEIYALVVDENDETVVTADDNLLFVNELSKIEHIYAFLDSERKSKYEVPAEMEKGIDLAGALYLLENEDVDNGSVILDCLNALFDLLKSINVEMPAETQKILFAFADHVTFSKDLDGYFQQSPAGRSEIIDHVMWCLGKVLSRARVL